MRDELPTEVYMLRNKVTGKLYKRKWTDAPLVWATKQGPASAKGQIRVNIRQNWCTVTLKVTNDA